MVCFLSISATMPPQPGSGQCVVTAADSGEDYFILHNNQMSVYYMSNYLQINYYITYVTDFSKPDSTSGRDSNESRSV